MPTETTSSSTTLRPRVFSKMRLTLVLVIAGIIGGVAFAFADPLRQMRQQESDPTPHLDASSDKTTSAGSAVYVSVIKAGDLSAPQTFARYRGVVQSRRESPLGFRRGGRVHAIAVHEGSRVRQGEVLAELDTSDLRSRKRQLEAELLRAQAQLDESIAGPRPQTIRAAAADVQRITAELGSARATLSRETNLQRRGAGTDRAWDDARFKTNQLEASLDAAQAKLNELEAGTRKEQIAASRAALAAAQAALDRLEVDFRDSEIVAPYDGMIVSRMVDEGTIVNPDAIVVQMIEAPPLEARFGLPDDIADSFQQGDSVTVESAHASHQAKVIRIHPALDQATRTRSIDVQFDALANLVTRQTVTLRLPRPSAKREVSELRFWVPTSALIRSSRGLWSVLVAVHDESMHTSTKSMDTATVQRRDVRVLQTSGNLSEITGMVTKGEPIIARGTHRVGPGVTVRMTFDEINPSDQLQP